MRNTKIGYLVAILLFTLQFFRVTSASMKEPEFAAPISSPTIIAGRDAALKCVIDNLGEYKVAWMKLDKQILLSIQTYVQTKNERIAVTHPNERTWYLHLRNVVPEDSGFYVCQIYTQPTKSQAGYLSVVVPPEFVTNTTNGNIAVTENANVTLSCKARGNPVPVIKWQREDGQPFIMGGTAVNHFEGDELTITGVTRKHMAAYLCEASNNIPPAVSRRIYLDVNFQPLIWIHNPLVQAPLGNNTSLECDTEAHPLSEDFWLKGEERISTNDKYEVITSKNSYKTHMKLIIRQLQYEDYGSYKCVAKNNFGETVGSMKLSRLKLPPTPITKAYKFEYFTKPPKRITVAVTQDYKAVTMEIERRENTNLPGYQQKYGDGRHNDESSSKNSAPLLTTNLSVYIIILRTIQSLYSQ